MPTFEFLNEIWDESGENVPNYKNAIRNLQASEKILQIKSPNRITKIHFKRGKYLVSQMRFDMGNGNWSVRPLRFTNIEDLQNFITSEHSIQNQSGGRKGSKRSTCRRINRREQKTRRRTRKDY